MAGYHAPLEQMTEANANFRQVLYTAPHSQLVLMSLKPEEDIGMESHQVDQFFRIESGSGLALIDGSEYSLKAGDCVIVPAGAQHNITNTGSENLQLYTIYSPAQHPDGTIHATKNEAQAAEAHEHNV